MGWAIKRPDGTYRGWNRNGQDDTLLPGESWVKLDDPPTITIPAVAPTQKDLAVVALKAMDPKVTTAQAIEDLIQYLQKIL